MNDVGNIAYRKLASCGEYRFDPEGKTYYNGTKLWGNGSRPIQRLIVKEPPNPRTKGIGGL